MSNANIGIVSTSNSFGQWVIIDGNLANSVNNLRNSNYVKDNGSFIIANGSFQTTQTTGTGLSIGSNALISGLTTMNTQITTGQASFGNNVFITNANSTTTIAGNLSVGVNAVVGNLTVMGSETIVGNTLFTTDTLILRQTLATSGNAQVIVLQGGTNGNAELRYLLASNVWQVTSNAQNGFLSLITTANIADSISNNNITMVASANAVEWAYNTAIAAYATANNTGPAYGQANAAYATANLANTTAKNAYAEANAAYNNAGIGIVDSILAYGQANAAYLQANAAYATANLANITANSAYAEANVALPLAGGTMTGIIYTNSPFIREGTVGGFLDGNYNAGGEGSDTTGVIYSIGGGYFPSAFDLGSMFGVGYTLTNYGTKTVPTNAISGHWGFYVAYEGQAVILLDAQNGGGYFNGVGNFGGGVSAPSFEDTTHGYDIYSLIVDAYTEANTAYSTAVTAENNATTALNKANLVGGIAYIISEVLGTNGYRKWSDGLIELWGQFVSVAGSLGVNFSSVTGATFASACYDCLLTPYGNAGAWYVVTPPSAGGFTVQSASAVTFGFKAFGK